MLHVGFKGENDLKNHKEEPVSVTFQECQQPGQDWEGVCFLSNAAYLRLIPSHWAECSREFTEESQNNLFIGSYGNISKLTVFCTLCQDSVGNRSLDIFTKTQVYISCLLLCKKIYPKFSSLKWQQQHLSSRSFWESEIWHGWWFLWLGFLMRLPSTGQPGCSHPWLCWKWIYFQVQVHIHGGWQEASHSALRA